MKFEPNLIIAWLWILLSFATGMVMGMFFHRENWLDGYGSFKRRMYRLGHISLFALGAVNLLFWLTAIHFSWNNSSATAASWMFIVGAITMPLCCLLMAHSKKMHFTFAVPVVSLIVGAGLTLYLIIHSP